MSIDKPEFKDRVSNAVAWVGFIYPAFFWFFFCLGELGVDVRPFKPLYPHDIKEFVAFGLYPCCALINYLMVGKMRLLPWKDIE
jgi:hypothetical protein